ncbi:uncharacterized protein MELLADRAFT_105585 [Melampsora larici-populina 98AG31]|uniref:Uncharacterized protein n=1 Tax=Melampsora larici-populina (strain 98AG31 / pathotype 3-4-7) TaxID=747676 RepID=F4RIQ1_MELLP|nr:uncharacterized protein MELLADRAFT_105585 [Melampsora larici-populina 98AG31]EGG07792.1 hypothetical protein MELLADRAFT_105585 [Melampsora larici-populina 98AG31]
MSDNIPSTSLSALVANPQQNSTFRDDLTSPPYSPRIITFDEFNEYSNSIMMESPPAGIDTCHEDYVHGPDGESIVQRGKRAHSPICSVLEPPNKRQKDHSDMTDLKSELSAIMSSSIPAMASTDLPLSSSQSVVPGSQSEHTLEAVPSVPSPPALSSTVFSTDLPALSSQYAVPSNSSDHSIISVPSSHCDHSIVSQVVPSTPALSSTDIPVSSSQSVVPSNRSDHSIISLSDVSNILPGVLGQSPTPECVLSSKRTHSQIGSVPDSSNKRQKNEQPIIPPVRSRIPTCRIPYKVSNGIVHRVSNVRSTIPSKLSLSNERRPHPKAPSQESNIRSANIPRNCLTSYKPSTSAGNPQTTKHQNLANTKKDQNLGNTKRAEGWFQHRIRTALPP